MIVSRTPLRISFLGGGTDYPNYYREHGGAVLSATIDKFCYLTVRRLPPFFEHRNRIVYRLTEQTKTVDEIQHPTVKAVMRQVGLDGLEIHHDGDLPARSGMGTSSAFTVGLLNACRALKGQMVSKLDLALEAIHLEQNILKETVGSQDQVAAAFGGINRVSFSGGGLTLRDGARIGEFSVDPVPLPPWRIDDLHSHLLLFFTGVSRTASEVAGTFVPALASNKHLDGAVQQVDDGLRILSDLGSIEPFGEILHHAWTVKRQLSGKVSTPEIDRLYKEAREAGAIGGKLLGAGGGGFLLFFARPKDHDAIRARLGLLHVPFKFESQGSRIVVYDP